MSDSVTADLVTTSPSDMLREMLNLAERRQISVSQLIIEAVVEAIEHNFPDQSTIPKTAFLV